MDLGSVGGSIAKQSIERLRSTLLSISSLLPTLNIARQSVFSSLSKIKEGTLTIVLPDGDEKVFGALDNGPSATVVVHKDSFWMRILLSADLGFAESYMLNEVSCSGLLEFFEIMILNQKRLSNLSTNVSTLFAAVTNMVMETADTSTLSRAQLNIAAHYDLSNDMFEGFLSPEMSYSCPIWLSRTEDGYKTDTLEKAQFRKLDHIIGELKIQSTDHVLEVGSGWGGFSIRAASTTGCRVTTLTLSIAQKQLAEERILAAGLSDKVQVLLCDYRTLPIPDILFDKFVAIEMMECSAEADLEVFFRRIDQLLKPDGGICYIQSTTMPDTRYANNFPKGEGFIPKYIFPGGHLASPTRIIAAVKKGAKDRFDVDSVTNYGSHYVKCLRLWKEQFKLNFKSKIVPSLQLQYPSLSAADVEIFRRKYIYYFTYCEAGFRTKMLHITHMVLSRQGTTALHNDVEF